MTRLLIAILIGAVLAVGAAVTTSTLLAGSSNGEPANAQLNNYGSR
jgi:outer membrane murein-binding lipoprotein Lpp